MTVHCIILARGGSKSIKNKNTVVFCGKPLLSWTIEQCLKSKKIDNIWLSSDDKKILSYAEKYRINKIIRPKNISNDHASSEKAWLHAIKYIESLGEKVNIIVAPQVTSPLRKINDLDKAIEKFKSYRYDSLFSANLIKDFFIWGYNKRNNLTSSNYDYKNRLRRQDINSQFVENGSFYIFKSDKFKKIKNRLYGKIGYIELEHWQMFEIDKSEDLKFCSIIMKNYLLKDL